MTNGRLGINVIEWVVLDLRFPRCETVYAQISVWGIADDQGDRRIDPGGATINDSPSIGMGRNRVVSGSGVFIQLRGETMRLVTVKLEVLKPHETIVIASDVCDSLGRLLLKAPHPLDLGTKEILLSRGVREIIIQDRREIARVDDEMAIRLELEALEKRMSLFDGSPEGDSFKELVCNTVSGFYEHRR
ncbi:MAG: hypothetical protein ACYCYP_08550 [Leptospirales bacterium]